jgi:hypothetical protein
MDLLLSRSVRIHSQKIKHWLEHCKGKIKGHCENGWGWEKCTKEMTVFANYNDRPRWWELNSLSLISFGKVHLFRFMGGVGIVGETEECTLDVINTDREVGHARSISLGWEVGTNPKLVLEDPSQCHHHQPHGASGCMQMSCLFVHNVKYWTLKFICGFRVQWSSC